MPSPKPLPIECDWCSARPPVAMRAFAPHKGAAQPMHACPECVERAQRFATLTNGGADKRGVEALVTDGPILSIEVEGRPDVHMREASAARAYMREAFPQAKAPRRKRARKPSPSKPSPRKRARVPESPEVAAEVAEVAADVFRASGAELRAMGTPAARAEIARRAAKREAKKVEASA